MILVLLGTQNNSFHRLLEEIQKNIDNGNIQDEVIAQKGYTKFESKNMTLYNQLPVDEIEQLIDKADLVITHGGVGSMITANQKGKKVIAVPRYKMYHEHVNDHQLKTIEMFGKRNYVIATKNVQDLEQALKDVKDFIPVVYEKDERSKVIQIIEDFIGN